jgi:hypothetical protein
MSVLTTYYPFIPFSKIRFSEFFPAYTVSFRQTFKKVGIYTLSFWQTAEFTPMFRVSFLQMAQFLPMFRVSFAQKNVFLGEANSKLVSFLFHENIYPCINIPFIKQ